MVKQKSVFILLGPSGVGKTSLGKYIAEHNNEVLFLSTGTRLWGNEVIRPWTETNIDFIKKQCKDMIAETFEEFVMSGRYRVLLLDCVKDLSDAEYITQQAKQYGLEISRVLKLPVPGADSVGSNLDAADLLQESWTSRDAPTFGLQKTARVYLARWQVNYKAVKNYYQRLNLLAILTEPQEIFGIINMSGQNEVRMAACPSYVRYLFLDSERNTILYNRVLSVLCMNSFKFSFPVSTVRCKRDVSWLVNHKRYHVAHKIANVVRFLLCNIDDKTFLINANREMFRCDIQSSRIPNNTILDGELFPSILLDSLDPSTEGVLKSQTSIFVVVDVLAVSNKVKWSLPFSMRETALDKIGIDENIAEAIYKGGLPTNTFFDDSDSTKLPVLPLHIVRKRYRPSTAANIEFCLNSTNQPYKISGLVFIPDMAYKSGEDPLGFQWHNSNEVRCFINANDLLNGLRPCDQNYLDVICKHSQDGCVIRCKWIDSNEWQPLFSSEVKSMPDSEDMIDQLQNIGQQPYKEKQLRDDIGNYSNSQANCKGFRNSYLLHPAYTYEFKELYNLLEKEVQDGRVQVTEDQETNLKLFNCVCPKSQKNEINQLCHGLVLHPQSSRVVTMPLTNFHTDLAKIIPSDLVEATVKFDGKCCVAFLWKNEVKVVTKDSMQSQPTRKAAQWFEEHCDKRRMRNGYTYVLEMIFQEYIKIVEYPFEGLILLSITNDEGQKVPYQEMLKLSQEIGFLMVTPRILGPLPEVLWYCAGRLPIIQRYELTECLSQASSFIQPRKEPNEWQFEAAKRDFSGVVSTAANQEGWVIWFGNGTCTNVVNNWWHRADRAAAMVTPCGVWLLVKYNWVDEVFKYLPKHLQKDFKRKVISLGKKFFEFYAQAEYFSMPIRQVDNNQSAIKESHRQLLDIASVLSQPENKMSTISPLYLKGNPGCSSIRLKILDFIWSTENYWEEIDVCSVLDSIQGRSILMSLPEEILLVILRFLDFKSLIMISRVCTKFHRIVSRENELNSEILWAEKVCVAPNSFSSEDYYSQDSNA